MSLKRLHLSANAENLNEAKRCLEEGCDVNERSSHAMTALHYAARRDSAEIVMLLLDHGADVEARDNNGMTPLHFSATTGSISIANLLLDKSAQINTCAKDGQTPLHLAIRQNEPNLVELLIRRGANFDAQDCEKCSPLHTAVKHRLVDVSKMLVEYGADTNLKDIRNMTALHWAVELAEIELAQCILRQRQTDVDAKTDSEYTALHRASHMGRCDLVKALLDRGASIDAKDKEGHTPVVIAELYEQSDVFDLLNCSAELIKVAKLNRKKKPENLLKKLLDSGASVNATDAAGMSALCHAINHDNSAVVKHLLKNGADCYTKSKLDQTPLHLATLRNNFNLCKLIVDQCSKHPETNEWLSYLNATDLDGNTALHFAAKWGNSSSLLLLLSRGAVYDAINQSDLRPIDVSKESAIAFFTYIENTFNQIDSDKDIFYVRENVRIYKWIRGARNRTGCTVFCVATQLNQVSLVEDILQDNAADLHNMITLDGYSVLHTACKNDNLFLVNKILDYMSSSDMLDFKSFDTGNTALHLSPNVAIARALLSRGASYCMKNKRGLTPQDYNNSDEVVQLLRLVDLSFRSKTLHNGTELANLLNARDGKGNSLRQVVDVGGNMQIETSVAVSKLR